MSKKLNLLLGLIVLIISLFCTSYKNKDVGKIKKIVISRNYPNIQSNGKIIYSIDNLAVYYYGDYEIYEYDSHQNFVTFRGNGEATNDSNRIVPAYFIRKKKQNIGINYNKGKEHPISTYQKMVINADSIIYKISAFSLDLDSTNLRLIETKSQLGVIEEKYVPKLKVSNPLSLIDTISFFFSKNMIDIDYSLSKKTDHLKNSKFVGYKAQFLSKYYGKHPVKIDDIYNYLDMKKVPVENVEFIVLLINQYEKDKNMLSSQH